MTVALTKFNDFVLQLGLKTHDLNADTLKILLSNTTPVATWTSISQATEITAGNGYTAGGFDVQNAYTLVAGVGSLAVVDYTMTASGGPISTFQYAILYNSTLISTANNLIAWGDYGSPIAMLDTQTCKFDFPPVLLTVTW